MDAPGFVIRPAAAADVAALRQLLVETWHATYDGIFGAERVREITNVWHAPDALKAQVEDPGQSLFVAERDGRLVGTSSSRRRGEAIGLTRLYVHPTAQRRGLGRALLHRVLDGDPEAARIVLDVHPGNAGAIAFYLAERFAAVSERQTETGAVLDLERVLHPGPTEMRPARDEDIEAIVRIFTGDPAGGHGDGWSSETRPAYRAAFAAIDRSPDNTVFVAEVQGRVIGTFQITIIPGLVGRGRTRAKIESVHVRRDMRGHGVGAVMMAFAEREAAQRGARLMELTSNKARGDAHRFYERLGFQRSHEGFKKTL